MAKHFHEWDSLVQNNDRVVVEAHRESWKTFFFSRSYPLWYALNKPGSRILLISFSEEQAKDNLNWIKLQAENNPLLRERLFPDSNSYTWQKTKLHFKNGSTIDAKGFGTSLRGGHYHLIIGDDLLKDSGAMPPEEMENFWFAVVTPASLKTGGRILVVGTPLHAGDLLEKIEEQSNYIVKKYPAYTIDGKIWFSDEYNEADMARRKRDIPYWVWSREYMLSRQNPDNAPFKIDDIRTYEPKTLVGSRLFKILTYDLAATEHGDMNAIVITGCDSGGTVYVLDSIYFRGNLDVQTDMLFSFYERHRPDVVGMEFYVFQRLMSHWLTKEMDRRRIWFTIVELEKNNKMNKNIRILGLQPLIKAHKIVFRKEDRGLIDELVNFDPGSKKNKDDGIDALSYQIGLWNTPEGEEISLDERSWAYMDREFDKCSGTNGKEAPEYLKGLFNDFDKTNFPNSEDEIEEAGETVRPTWDPDRPRDFFRETNPGYIKPPRED